MQLTTYDSVSLVLLLYLFDIFAAVVLRSRGRSLVAIAMGAVTGCVGGIIRDTLGQVPSVLLRHEVYVTASVLGACTSAGLNAVGESRPAAMITGFLVTFIVRSLAIVFGWSLPVFGASSDGGTDEHKK